MTSTEAHSETLEEWSVTYYPNGVIPARPWHNPCVKATILDPTDSSAMTDLKAAHRRGPHTTPWHVGAET